MINIKSFNEFSNFVWEPKRIPNEQQYMPDDNNIKLYKKSVKEELIKMLQSLYQLTSKQVKHTNNAIWDTHFNDWKDIFEDCLVNWDTPEICAQKCINSLKSHLNLE